MQTSIPNCPITQICLILGFWFLEFKPPFPYPHQPNKPQLQKPNQFKRRRLGGRVHTLKATVTNVEVWNRRCHVIIHRYDSNTENLRIILWIFHLFFLEFTQSSSNSAALVWVFGFYSATVRNFSCTLWVDISRPVTLSLLLQLPSSNFFRDYFFH